MILKRLFFFLVLLTISISCSDEEGLCTANLDCLTSSDITIVAEEDIAQTSLYYRVYCYQNETYTVLVCPLCFIPIAPMALNCNGIQLCEEGDNCMQQFFEDADYLYSYEEN